MALGYVLLAAVLAGIGLLPRPAVSTADQESNNRPGTDALVAKA